MSRQRFWINLISQYGALFTVAASIGLKLYRSSGPWWLVILLAVGLGILYSQWPVNHKHIYLAVETLLAAALLLLDTIALLLFFTLAVHAVMLFPNRTGAWWIAVFILLNAVLFFISDGFVDGLLPAFGVGLGLAMFGYFTYSRIEAEAARRKAQTLLGELQAAHQKLQAYAEQVETMAVVEERNRLARDLHDTLGHRLTVASVQLEGAQRLIPSDPVRAARMVGTVREQVSEALRELRQTVTALRSPAERDWPLSDSLRRLAASFEEATGIQVHLTLPGELPPLSDSHRMTLYRAVQESLTNVQRHAQVQEAWVEVSLENGVLALRVRDQGVGIADIAGQAGFGLRGLRERAEQLGGQLEVEPGPGGGTVINMILPSGVEEVHG